MQYAFVTKGRFISRPNRFVAMVELDGQPTVCHVKNTGRCGELLLPGAAVWLARGENPNRKTAWDLVTVRKETTGVLINIDSQAPNAVVGEALHGGKIWQDVTLVKPEKVFGDSRVDFYLERADGRKVFLEVKGVTLEQDGVARFPDAPTERGVKHLKELEKAAAQGFEAAILFVVQMKGVDRVEPNIAAHPAFAEALRHAVDAGVRALAYDCVVSPDSLLLDSPVPVHIL